MVRLLKLALHWCSQLGNWTWAHDRTASRAQATVGAPLAGKSGEASLHCCQKQTCSQQVL